MAETIIEILLEGFFIYTGDLLQNALGLTPDFGFSLLVIVLGIRYSVVSYMFWRKHKKLNTNSKMNTYLCQLGWDKEIFPIEIRGSDWGVSESLIVDNFGDFLSYFLFRQTGT